MKVENYEDILDDGYLDYMNYRENLPEVFNTKLDLFPNVKKHQITGKQINLYNLFQKIKYNLAEDITPDILLTHKYLGKERNPVYDENKKKLPLVAFNATFQGYKAVENVKSITNIMYLDIDTFQTGQEAEEHKEQLIEKYPWIISCYRSLSKLGLHVIIQVDKIHDNDDYNGKYDYISKRYFEGRLDPNAKSLSRFTIIPYDYNIYVNDSPDVLGIDIEYQEFKKGIRSACDKSSILGLSENKKGIRSALAGGEKVCTAYTFSSNPPLKEIMNDAARKHRLKFQMELDESQFEDPNIPIYVHEGLPVIKINLFPYRYYGVELGYRNSFIGAITVQMLYLNTKSNEYIDPEIRKSILNFIFSINNRICKPPLEKPEVIESFNKNCNRYLKGKVNVSKYYKKQRAFWSTESTLKGNEKRKVTCKIKNEPIVAESKRKIKQAIEDIKTMGEKITQKKVAEVSGMKLPTIKKYRDYYNQLSGKRKYRTVVKNAEVVDNTTQLDKYDFTIDSMRDENIESGETFSSFTDNASKEFNDKSVVIKSVIADIDTIFEGEKFIISDDQTQEIFKRVFKSFLKKMDENQEKELFTKFVTRLNSLPQGDVKILTISNDELDNNTYWSQSTLDSEFWVLCNGIL